MNVKTFSKEQQKCAATITSQFFDKYAEFMKNKGFDINDAIIFMKMFVEYVIIKAIGPQAGVCFLEDTLNGWKERYYTETTLRGNVREVLDKLFEEIKNLKSDMKDKENVNPF